jgi:two-component system, OmpR family, phosphate regulon response regulator PhoB
VGIAAILLCQCVTPNDRAGQRHKPIILVVDDEKVITDTLVIVLDLQGFRARGAYDVPGALSLLDEITPDLVITDDVMPGTWGSHLCAELRSRPETAAVPIIMLGDSWRLTH